MITTYTPSNFQNGITTLFNGVTSAPGLQIAGSGSPTVKHANTITSLVSDTLGVPLTTGNMPALNGGNLANNYSRMYTFLIDVNTSTGATTLSVVRGNDFTHDRPAHPSTDINYGDGTKGIVGFVYIKNESGSDFVPGTTHLDAAGLTVSYGDGYGYPIWVPLNV